MTKSRATFRAVFAVARASVAEALGQPAAILLALASAETVALQPLVQLHSFGEPGRLTRDCAFAVLMLAGAALAALCSSATLASELRDGTAAPLLARPVPRAAFLCGKFLGASIACAVLSWCVAWTAMLACRTAEAWVETARTAGDIRDTICGVVSVALPAMALAAAAFRNARRGTRLGTAFFAAFAILAPLSALPLGLFARDGSWLGVSAWNPALDFRLAAPALGEWMLLCAFCAAGTAAGAIMPPAAAAAAAFLPLLAGFFTAGLTTTGGLQARIITALLPSVQDFWLADLLARGGRVGAGILALAAVHCAAWCAFVLSIGSMAFGKRDL